MSYIGAYAIDDLLTFYVVTQVFSTGVATDADSAPAYRVYEDETTSPLLTGTMALLDSSNTAGFYSEQITLSAANGFEKGKCYSIHIAATVSSVAGATWRQFQIQSAVDVKSIAGSAVSTSSAQIGVNVVQISGDSGAADNLETAADGGSYNLGGGGVVAASVTGNVGGNVTGSVGSVATGGISSGSFAAGAIDATAIAANAIGSSEIADGAITAAKIADGAIDAATFAAGAIDAAAIATNAIDADALAADAVTEIQSGLSTLTQANVRTAVGLASANLDTQLDALPTASENATALLDASDGVETSITPRGAFRLMLAALAGKLSGAATTTVTIRNVGDSKDRITATVDSDGNRSAVTTDAT